LLPGIIARIPNRPPPRRHGHPDKPCQRILCTSINVCRPYVLSSTSSSNHAGKRQYDASMHDRRFIGIEGLSLTEHGRHMCTLAQTKSWHGLPRRASERAPGLFASRAGSWWRPQRRRCATGLVVLLGWCDHPDHDTIDCPLVRLRPHIQEVYTDPHFCLTS